MPLFNDHWAVMTSDCKLTQASQRGQMQSELMKLHGQFSHITNGIQCTIPIVCPVMPNRVLALIIDNKHYVNAINGHLLVLDGIHVTICWTSDSVYNSNRVSCYAK